MLGRLNSYIFHRWYEEDDIGQQQWLTITKCLNWGTVLEMLSHLKTKSEKGAVYKYTDGSFQIYCTFNQKQQLFLFAPR